MSFFLDFLFPKKCLGCGKFGDYVCEACRVGMWEAEPGPRPADLDGLICPWAYDGLVKKLLKRAKYRGEYDLLKFLISPPAPAMLEALRAGNIQAVVPVPLHKSRLKERGFNQAKIIAEEVAEIWHLPLVDCLIRTKDTGHQTLRARSERLKALKNAFSISPHPPLNLRGGVERVILVDDVLTTGATLSECAKTLKKAGVRKVYGLVLAR